MKRAIIFGTALLACGAAFAEGKPPHDILILPDTYFPEVTYLKPGDKVKFVNVSGDEHTIVSSSGSWTIGPLQVNEEHTMVVNNELERTFHNANAFNSDGSYAVTGDISFDASPVD